MIGFQIVNLLSKDQSPHVFAEELDNVQRIHESRPIPRKPTGPSHLSADNFVVRSSWATWIIIRLHAPSLKNACNTRVQMIIYRKYSTSRPGPARPGSPAYPVAEMPLPFVRPRRQTSSRHFVQALILGGVYMLEAPFQ